MDYRLILTHGYSYDLETHLVQPGLPAPPLVCGSIGRWDPATSRIQGGLYDARTAVESLIQILRTPASIVVGQNIQFDLIVSIVYAATKLGVDITPDVFRAYDEGRVFDIGIAEQLHAIALGTLLRDPRTGKDLRDPITGEPRVGYRLSVVVDLVLGRIDAKLNDRWRGSYAQLEPFPISMWPTEARQYPIDDAVNTLEVAMAQVGLLPSTRMHEWVRGSCRRCGLSEGAARLTGRAAATCRTHASNLNLHDLAAQAKEDFALHLGAAWGLLVDPEMIDKVKDDLECEEPDGTLTRRGEQREVFRKAGILRSDGSEDQALLKRLTAIAYGAGGEHAACEGKGKVPTKWSVREPKRPLAWKNCVECSGTGLDLTSSRLIPMTEPSKKFPNGQVQTSRDALGETGDDLLSAYANYTEDRKIGTVYVPWLEGGIVVDAQGNKRRIPITLRPHVLLETGRTSYSGVVQLLPRKSGVRKCIVPRPGRVFSTTDYEAGELITHAQSCLWIVGESALAEALLRKVKPHNALAATILGISYEEFNRRYDEKDRQAVDTRQACKPANFGFPGRMGPVTLVHQQRKGGPDTPHPSGPIWIELEDGSVVRGYKGLRFCLLMDKTARACGEVKVTKWGRREFAPTCKKCIEAAAWLREGWLKQWPENGPYFKHVEEAEEAGGMIAQHVSKRLRTPTPNENGIGNSLANGYFQALLADLAKAALYEITRESYVPIVIDDPSSRFHGEVSPLYRSVTRSPVFAHDEVISEHNADLAHEAAMRNSEIMVASMRRYCPDLAPAANAEPALMPRWYKSASPVIHGDRLVPWTPEHNRKSCPECAAQAARDKERKAAKAEARA